MINGTKWKKRYGSATYFAKDLKNVLAKIQL